MSQFFEIASKISSAWSLAAFAIIALIFLVIKVKGHKVPTVAWAVVAAIVIIALAPIIAPAYLNSYGIYRVRVVVLDDRQMPTNDTHVTCSTGGEVKKVEGGWECDIPSKTKPSDGKMQVYASVPEAYLTGFVELELKDDYSPVVTLRLSKDTSAKIMGMVIDENHLPLEGVQVGVVGYESEAVTTQPAGSFSLRSHKASGQQVQLYVIKSGYSALQEWHQAGDFPITIILPRQRAAKQKPG
jgi:hypothetical protein